MSSSKPQQPTSLQTKKTFGIIAGLAATLLVVTQISSSIIAPTVNAVTIPSASYSDAEFTSYDGFFCNAPVTGAKTLTGAAAYNNVGTLGAALASGNFVGVKDGVAVFKDATGNMEQYSLLTGAAFYEDAPGGPMKPFSGVTPNPHAFENVINTDNTLNPNFIDTYDFGVMMLDADGTNSTYVTYNAITGGQLLYDYSYTALSGGGNSSGLTMTNLKADPRFIGIENLSFVMLNAAGTGSELYSTVTGAYTGPYSLTNAFYLGPLNGKTLKDAVDDTHGIAGIKFLGVGETDYVFYDSVNKKVISYNLLNHWNTYETAGPLSLGAFAGSLDAAMTGGRFLGVGNTALFFIDAVGQTHAYNYANAVGVGISPFQRLEGPQANQPTMLNLIDTADGGYVYLDDDGSTSIYYSNGAVFADQKWTKFTGGILDGQAPSKTNILATEDGYYYALGTDGSIEGYVYSTGALYPDVLTCTSFVGGVLDGKTVADAVTNKIPGTTFLGIANARFIFATTPVTTTTSSSQSNSSSAVAVSSSSMAVSSSSASTSTASVTASSSAISSEVSSMVTISSSSLPSPSSQSSTANSTLANSGVTQSGGGVIVIGTNNANTQSIKIKNEELEIKDPYTCGKDIVGQAVSSNLSKITVELKSATNSYSFNPSFDANGNYSFVPTDKGVVAGKYTVTYFAETSTGLKSDKFSYEADIKNLADCSNNSTIVASLPPVVSGLSKQNTTSTTIDPKLETSLVRSGAYENSTVAIFMMIFSLMLLSSLNLAKHEDK